MGTISHSVGESNTHTRGGQVDIRKRAIAVGIGNFMEWFDFAVYGYFAAVIGMLFFPSSAPGVSLLSSLAVFAVGFLSRPFGALILGPIGDRFGRRAVLIITVFGMGVCTTIIGLLPTYEAIGIAAPVLLIAMRFVQGMMVGGEWSSAGIYIVESAPANRRATAASVITGTAGLAFLFGTFVAATITTTLSDAQLTAWGWRLPFVASIVMTGIAIFIRRKLGDTPVYEEMVRQRDSAQAPSKAVRRRAFITTFAFSALFGVSLYYFVTYANNHLVTTVGLPRSTALWLCSIALVVYVIVNPLIGRLSDRIGRRKLLLGAAAALTVLAFPIFLLINSGNSAAILLGLIILGVLVAVTAVMDVVLLVEVFPASIRSTGAALGHNLALAILAGPGPFIAAALIRMTGDANLPAAYLAGVSLLCLLVLCKTLPETRDNDISRF
ncbi:MFS transporter [Pseudomonas wayambapalatensis]|uniref:MFS transporter n=1 Tax=Pseudomonas putida TaxID=303 RepID=A0AAD0L4E3_PSEPU|nr:MFS transporter [Pseudomonas putida]MBC3466129.1 MFS transporter [Pseudomonas sp. RW10S2]QXI42790.1 MFS transporter [Pseudomonas wayambapalatensis]HEK0908962.1 MFS transporter [Pseudomonas putida]HEK1767317.1 MFS transporter [Pseudomonas putida]